MADYRLENITKLLQDQRTLSNKLVEMLAPEIMQYDMLEADLERKRGELKTLEEQKTLARLEIEKAKETASGIIAVGKEEAEKLFEMAKKNTLSITGEAQELMRKVKEFVSEADKKRYQKLIDEKDKLAKSAA